MMKKEFYKDVMFWFGVAGFIGVIFSAISLFYIPKKNLEIRVEKLVNLFDIKDNGINLKVFLKDSIEIDESNKNIAIYEIEVKNWGGENIRTDDYDSSLDFGIKIKNGEILKNPEIIGTSDTLYFNDVIQSTTLESIILKKKIIDSDNFFKIKFFVLHDRQTIPSLFSLGKISGQKSIPILNEIKTDKTENEIIRGYEEKIQLVFISLIFTLLGFAGLVYAYLKSIKNQRLISEQKRLISEQKWIIENSLVEKDELLKEIEKLRNERNMEI